MIYIYQSKEIKKTTKPDCAFAMNWSFDNQNKYSEESSNFFFFGCRMSTFLSLGRAFKGGIIILVFISTVLRIVGVRITIGAGIILFFNLLYIAEPLGHY